MRESSRLSWMSMRIARRALCRSAAAEAGGEGGITGRSAVRSAGPDEETWLQGDARPELHAAKTEKFASSTFDALDAEIRAVFSSHEIVTPDDVRGSQGTRVSPQNEQAAPPPPVQLREAHWFIADLHGKGGHIRTVPMPDWVKRAIGQWAAPRRNLFRPAIQSQQQSWSGIGEWLHPESDLAHR